MIITLVALTLVAMTVQAAQVNPQAAALNEFSKRLQAYLQLREALGRKLGPQTATASASELQTRQHSHAAALRDARTGARQGDLIPAMIQEQIRGTVQADFRRRPPAAKKASLDEVPSGPMPGINQPYPEEVAMPTVPALLLAKLPRLPDNLQYRFFARHVAIVDGDLQIVIDYVQNALPR